MSGATSIPAGVPLPRRSVLMAAIVAAAVFGGCAGGSAPPTGPAAPTTGATAVPGSGGPGGATAGVPTQSETGWGAIWDALPSSFPVPVEARAAEPDAGPVSAAYVVPVTASSPAAIARFVESGLGAVGYATGLDGPLEDGSYTVWSSSGDGCDTLTTILPRGAESLITILYGAGCRFE